MWQPAEPREVETRLGAFALAAIGAALLAMFWPLTLGRLFLYADLGGFFLPIRLFFSERLARGESALWLPNLFCGFHLHGEGQLGIYHPLRRLAYLFLPVDRAFALECLLPLPLALAGFSLWLRRLGLPRPAALFGGICFGLSPFLTLRLTHLNSIAVLAHVPWLLLASDVLVRGRRARTRDVAWVWLALLTGSQLLIGYPPAIVFSLLVEALYAVSLRVRGASAAPLLALAAAKVVGLLLGAPQWIATWLEIDNSLRARAGFDYVAQQSLHPVNLLLPFSPWLFRDRVYQVEVFNPIEQAFYLGAVVPVAVAWALARSRRLAWPRSATFSLVALAVLALALSLGRYLPGFRLFAELPLVGLLRIPSRYTLVVTMVGATLAALAFADLCRAPPSRAEASLALRLIWLPPGIALAVAAGALALRHESHGFEMLGAAWLRPPAELVWGPILLIVAAALFHAAARGMCFALPALFVFTLADLGSYGVTLWWSDPPQTLAQYLASVPRPPAVPPDRLTTGYGMRIERTADGSAHYHEATRLIVHDTRLVGGYCGLAPARVLDYFEPKVLRLAGASFAEIRGQYEPLPTPFPRARIVARSVTSAEPALALAAIDPADTAVVGTPLALGGGPPGEATVLEDVPGRIRVRVAAPTRQLLVLTESFHPGWQARCDGAPCAAVRVYGDFLGSVVEPGTREIELRFAPASVERGMALAVLGLLGVIGYPLASVLAARRSAARAPEAA